MDIMPIDTVKVMFYIDPSLISLNSWMHRTKEKGSDGDKCIFQDEYTKNRYSKNGTRVGLTFRPYDLYGKGNNLLFIELSLPKLIYGCNHKMIVDWKKSIPRINNEILKATGIPGLDITDGILYRLDICVNFQVGENVKDYVQALLKGHYPRRRTLPYQTTGVLFKTNKPGISIAFYDKQFECSHSDASGILRAEISIRKKGKITDKLKKSDISLQGISGDKLLKIMGADLKILGLDKTVVCDRLAIENLLSQKYGPRRVRTLIGYWIERQTKTVDQIIAEGTSRRCICYYQKLLKEAGIASISYDSHVSLPSLMPQLRKMTTQFVTKA